MKENKKEIGDILLEIFVNSKLGLIEGAPKKRKILKFLGNTKLRSNLNDNEYKKIEEVTYNLLKSRKNKTRKEYTEFIMEEKKIYNEYMKGNFSEDFVKELENQRKQDIAKEKENGKDTIK
jgi:hypothetical protein